MNQYDNYFTFRLATVQDIDAIMTFIKEEWSASHILANDREFFQWQYGNEQFGDTDTINVLLMLDKKGEIAGINGFISYAPEDGDRYVSSAITQVKPDLEIPLCGVELIKRFKQMVPANAYYSSGTNPKTMIPIGKRVFHYTTGIMQQFYMLNDQMDTYEVAHVEHEVSNSYEHTGTVLKLLKDISDAEGRFDFGKKEQFQGYKSKEFINKRYFKHPIYGYCVFGVEDMEPDVYSALLIGREIEVGQRKVLRLVDFIGNISRLAELGSALHQLMYENQYEYIDLMAGTLPVELMSKSGFVLREPEDTNIIPTYFEPFVQENINIWYQKSDPDIVIFKADGDQDRPNSRKG